MLHHVATFRFNSVYTACSRNPRVGGNLGLPRNYRLMSMRTVSYRPTPRRPVPHRVAAFRRAARFNSTCPLIDSSVGGLLGLYLPRKNHRVVAPLGAAFRNAALRPALYCYMTQRSRSSSYGGRAPWVDQGIIVTCHDVTSLSEPLHGASLRRVLLRIVPHFALQRLNSTVPLILTGGRAPWVMLKELRHVSRGIVSSCSATSRRVPKRIVSIRPVPQLNVHRSSLRWRAETLGYQGIVVTRHPIARRFILWHYASHPIVPIRGELCLNSTIRSSLRVVGGNLELSRVNKPTH
jgi:hypothetical protein